VSFLDAVRRRTEDYPPYYEAPAGPHKRYDQNVNLLGPHPAVRESVRTEDAHLYPNRDNKPLLDALAHAFQLPADHFWVGNGSDEILDLLFRLFLEPGQRLVVPTPSYSMYPHLARLSRVAYVAVATNDDFQITASKLLAHKPDLVLVCNPNNPTGTLFDPRLVGELLESFEGPVVVDEAYAEFAGASVLPLVDRFPNLIVTRTLSKAYGLAGLRVGFGVGHPAVAELVRRAKPPFAVNVLSEQIAVRALRDRTHVETAIATIVRERERLAQGLASLGFRVWPSHANFLLTLPPIGCEDLHERLKQKGILVRLYRHEPALRDHVRFTVGSAADTHLLLTTLEEILGRAPSQKVKGP
jgi:histidinol-phosphate aminotransferase